MAQVKRGLRTLLLVPMLRNDELIGTLAISRKHVEPFTEKEIELVADFATQATNALEIVRRERQLRQVQMELARANRVATVGQLNTSIANELTYVVLMIAYVYGVRHFRGKHYFAASIAGAIIGIAFLC